MANRPIPGGLGRFYFTTSIINGITTTVNGHLSRKHQEKMEDKRQALTLQLEETKQNFQIDQSERNARLQKELSLQNHALRLEEQRISMESRCSELEWSRFLSTWPLENLPMVLRNEQLLPDNTVALRVIFAKSSNTIFQQTVFPIVEQGLREFVQLYHNQFRSKNIQFYQNTFVGKISGGAAVKNIHYALQDLPTIVIDCNVLLNEIIVSLDMWGFGSVTPEEVTFFRIPYTQKLNEKGQVITSYYKDIANQLLARMKFVLGYAYDGYNLTQYNRPPLLPQVAEFDKANAAVGPMLDDEEVTEVLAEKYGEIYEAVIGCGENAVAQLPESYKQTILHELRLEYAQATKAYISAEQYVQYLNESLDAWAFLRSTLDTADFLQGVLDGSIPVQKYFSHKDKAYFDQLRRCYGGTDADYQNLVTEICGVLETADLGGANTAALPRPTTQSVQPLPVPVKPPAPKKRKFDL